MKYRMLAMSAACLVGSGAHAQSSVTLYGVADVGFEYLNHAVASNGTVAAGAADHDVRVLAGHLHLLHRLLPHDGLVQADVVQHGAERVVRVVVRGSVLRAR